MPFPSIVTWRAGGLGFGFDFGFDLGLAAALTAVLACTVGCRPAIQLATAALPAARCNPSTKSPRFGRACLPGGPRLRAAPVFGSRCFKGSHRVAKQGLTPF